MLSLSRPLGGLAFLSACQTATGDEDLTDEAVHIAAGMLFAGYGGVVGTMWSISDRIAPVVPRDVYEYLFRNGTRPDYREAARALHEAIGDLRDNGEVSFNEWVPFIHHDPCRPMKLFHAFIVLYTVFIGDGVNTCSISIVNSAHCSRPPFGAAT
ncbi:hypothetical protein JVT61DRAFT_9798 [Boletus reticuloceps]|uniref:CHAT domain-containing protein n=1 Tax=Boletus reticuloceps TaxID=495285 RepID=A0A8I3A4X4_9AGAM|nr:hypothetical protein JVT61DRAFT_9798 [Boletus reticuloceps]